MFTSIGWLAGFILDFGQQLASKVLEQVGLELSAPKSQPPGERASEKRRPGHGRHGAEAYRGARRIKVAHASLKLGDHCPECWKGKVYAQKEPALRIRLVGQAPLEATVYELEGFRCNLCGEVFEAEAPEEVGKKKYDETSASMIGLLKYGSGVPFYRLAGLEESLGIPLPASTQWGIIRETAERIRPAMEELIRQAGQGEVVYNDDTRMKILALARASPHPVGAEEKASDSGERTGQFTSGIVSTRQGDRMALFFTGRRHAGENLAQVLARRAAELAPPIQMCDALSRNLPKLPEKLAVIVAHCLAHGRRRFIEVAPNFPEACRYVLETLGEGRTRWAGPPSPCEWLPYGSRTH